MAIDLKGPQDYLAFLKRRKWHMVLPAMGMFALSAAAAFLWPPVYRSSATILIEEPDVPRELVRSTVTSFASQRIQVITKRVLTRLKLIEIIEKFDLYRKARKKQPVGSIAERMRGAISLDLVSADVIDPRSGRLTEATIAFTLSFEHRTPQTAQKIVNELVSLYLGENLRARRAKAAETTGFLAMEADKVSRRISSLETAVADFKLRHAGNLPEQLAINLQLMDRTERDLIELRRRVQSLDERKIYLEAELAQLNPYSSVMIEGRRIMTPEERLTVRQSEFVSLSGVYGAAHPDVVKLAREIEALKKETSEGGVATELVRQREFLEAELAVAREKYAEAHPDVVKLKGQLTRVRAALTDESKMPTPDRPANPDNPAYIQFQAQLEAIQSELRSLGAQRAVLAGKLSAFEKKVLNTPEVEREYLLLKRDYENAAAKYQEVKAKQMAAELGEALEEERKSEKFSLIEPPTAPLEPIKPNRLAILVLGFFFSLTGGLGVGALAEALDQAIYGSRQLAAVTGAMPLVVIPYIENRADVRRTMGLRTLVVLGVIVGVVVGLYAVNEFVRPLDVLWTMAVRRLGLL